MYFILIFGPPAVGKMAVGKAIEQATGIRLFHNHMTIEPVLRFFEFGTPAFSRLVDGFRLRIFEEVAGSELPGLTFTFVWDLDSPADTAFVERTCRIFSARGAKIVCVELRSPLDVRLARNVSPDRLLEKPSKRDLETSERNLRDLERYRMNSGGSLPLEIPHIVIDNSHSSAFEVAQQVIVRFGLPRRGDERRDE